MYCLGCNLKVKNMKELNAHLRSHQDCVDKIEEQRLDNPNVEYVNPIYKKIQTRREWIKEKRK